MSRKLFSLLLVFSIAMVCALVPFASEAGSAALAHGKMEATMELAGGGESLDPADFEISREFFSEENGAGPIMEKLFPTAEPSHGGFAYSFIHVSDIQVRDRTRPPMQKILGATDASVETSENNFYQDHADLFYLGYALRAIRASVVGGPAEFAIHTGDAMHIGRLNELFAYNRMVEDFALREGPGADGGFEKSWMAAPISKDGVEISAFFNLIGNHDVFWLGNLRSPRMMRNNLPTWVSMSHDLETSLTNYNRLRSQVKDLDRAMGRSGPLELNPAAISAGPIEVHEPPDDARAYFHFDLAIPGHPQNKLARMIVLNTNEPAVAKITGAYAGAMTSRQEAWLIGLLDEADGRGDIDHVLVFGHQRLKDVGIARPGGTKVREVGRLKDLLIERPKVIAYLRGHWHKGEVVEWDKDESGAARLVEFGAPALMEYPKSISYVTVKSAGAGRWELSARHPNLEDLIQSGAVDASALIEQGLVERGESEFRFRTPYLGEGEEKLRALVDYLDSNGLSGHDRMLYLALLSINGADADAVKIRAADYFELDQHTFEEWREAPERNKQKYEAHRVVVK